ncbi:hypothetical protein EZBTHKR_2250 [Elizabethkingia anophelis]|nr:hypothetical protein EZBTHKR_2250 [Elizabethkingia anophelis]
MSKSPENLSRLDRVHVIKEMSGLTQEELFESEEIVTS